MSEAGVISIPKLYTELDKTLNDVSSAYDISIPKLYTELDSKIV